MTSLIKILRAVTPKSTPKTQRKYITVQIPVEDYQDLLTKGHLTKNPRTIMANQEQVSGPPPTEPREEGHEDHPEGSPNEQANGEHQREDQRMDLTRDDCNPVDEGQQAQHLICVPNGGQPQYAVFNGLQLGPNPFTGVDTGVTVRRGNRERLATPDTGDDSSSSDGEWRDMDEETDRIQQHTATQQQEYKIL
jgi:hypothetical protein